MVASKTSLPSPSDYDILEYEKKLKILEKENADLSNKILMLSRDSPQDKLDGGAAEVKRLMDQMQILSKQNKGS